MKNPDDVRKDRFYLGFNKDTGELVEVVPPSGKELLLDPADFHLFSLGKLDDDKAQKFFLDRLEDFNRQIKRNARPSMTLTLLDRECGSVCGGSCGGIPFRFC